MRLELVPGAISVLALLAASPASAQVVDESAGVSTSDDIIVTATRSGETRLQDTPMAITAVDNELLENSASRDIRDLQTFTPSLSIAQNVTAAQPYIRGIGSNNIFAGSDPSTALYIDGVYIARPLGFFVDLFDVERVEVLRGPQGTLYGRNAVGGAINVISRRPGEDLEASGALTVGSYDLIRAQGYVSMPISPTMSVSLSGRVSERDGYFSNAVSGVGPADAEDDQSVRGQFYWHPTNQWDILLRADYSDSASTSGSGLKPRMPTPWDPIVNSLANEPFALAFNTAPQLSRETWGASLEAAYQFSPSLRLWSLTSYRNNDSFTVLDSDFSAASVRVTNIGEDQSQFSQEINLAGNAGALTYVIGAYYFEEDIDAPTTVSNLPAVRVNIAPTVHTEALAAYAQGTLELTPEFSITAGLRYTDEQKQFDQFFGLQSIPTGLFLAGYPVTYVAEGSYQAWTPRIGAEYRPNDNLLLYVSATRGYKSGGFSYTSSNSFQGYDPEQVWAYEGGLKSDLFDNHLRFNLTAFQYDYQDLQVQSFITPGVIDITNAANARITGVELEARLHATDWLDLGVAATYLDATYEDYPDAIGPGNIPYDASGHRLTAAPEWAYNIYASVDHTMSSGHRLVGRVDYAWKSEQFFTPQNVAIESQGDYGLLNANVSLAFPGERFEIGVFARNLGDEPYFTTTATIGGVTYGTLGVPLTAGVQLTARY